MEQMNSIPQISEEQIQEATNRKLNGAYGFIYVTTNLINGKKYCGQKKFAAYGGHWQYYLGSGKLLRRAVEKYGCEHFARSIIDYGNSKEELDTKEKFWISFYNAVDDKQWYNIARGGTVIGLRGENAPMSILTNSDVLKIIDCFNRRESSMDIASDFKISVDTIRLIRKHKTWRHLTSGCYFEYVNDNFQKVYQYDLSGRFIKEFDSVKEAGESINLCPSNICAVANGKQQTCGGYIWKYYKADSGQLSALELSWHVDRHRRSDSDTVYQFDVSGCLIACYDSVSLASKKTGIDYYKILNACIGRRSSLQEGYVWRYESQHKLFERRANGCSNAISQFDLNGEFIAQYASIYEAANKFNCSYESIHDCCVGHSLTSCGYIWKYSANDPFHLDDERIKRATNKYEKKIRQCTLDGSKLAEFNSVESAALLTGYDEAEIQRACKSGKPYQNSIWKQGAKDGKCKISCFTLSGNYICSYDTMSAAAHDGYNTPSICTAIKQKYGKYRDRIWTTWFTHLLPNQQEEELSKYISRAT